MTTSPMRDVWIHIVTWVLLTSTIACGIWQMIASGKAISPLLISSKIVPPLLIKVMYDPDKHSVLPEDDRIEHQEVVMDLK